ncbi:MAG TPA: hypothetical protein VJ830_05915, partial [Anaerolineales bacterium]|nr:hypothetical protein [Anaerolineales bacterium]
MSTHRRNKEQLLHKWLVLLTILTFFSLLIAPVGTAYAQPKVADVSSQCPSYQPGILQEKELLDTLTLECIRVYKEAVRQTYTFEKEAASALPAQAGSEPDGFGYTYHDAVPYNWINATINSGLIGDDNFTGPLDIGFSFPFYGIPQTQLYLSTNGLITFGGGSREWDGFWIKDKGKPNNLIAPFMDDLLVGSPYNSGAIYYSRGGSA